MTRISWYHEGPVLEVSQLVKTYKTVRAVDSLSFTIQPGEIVGLIGPNGAGKTTALRCCAGILRPTSGSVRINGHDILTDQAKAKGGLAYVPEVPSLYELLTVDEHLRFVAMCYGTVDVYEARGTELLEKYHLLEKKNELIATLSKGMRQKFSVACALIHRANVLLFDEPLIGIDPAGVAEIKKEFMTARDQGCSVVISTHLLDTAERLCDRILIVARGRLLFEGTLTQLRGLGTNPNATLEDLFLEMTEENVVAPPPLSGL